MVFFSSSRNVPTKSDRMDFPIRRTSTFDGDVVFGRALTRVTFGPTRMRLDVSTLAVATARRFREALACRCLRVMFEILSRIDRRTTVAFSVMPSRTNVGSVRQVESTDESA